MRFGFIEGQTPRSKAYLQFEAEEREKAERPARELEAANIRLIAEIHQTELAILKRTYATEADEGLDTPKWDGAYEGHEGRDGKV